MDRQTDSWEPEKCVRVGGYGHVAGERTFLGAKPKFPLFLTGISSQIGTKLRDWAVRQARADCYSQAALSSNDSKTLYYAWVSQ